MGSPDVDNDPGPVHLKAEEVIAVSRLEVQTGLVKFSAITKDTEFNVIEDLPGRYQCSVVAKGNEVVFREDPAATPQKCIQSCTQSGRQTNRRAYLPLLDTELRKYIKVKPGDVFTISGSFLVILRVEENTAWYQITDYHTSIVGRMISTDVSGWKPVL